MLQTVMNYGKKYIQRIEATWGQPVTVAANMILITQERHKGAGMLFFLLFLAVLPLDIMCNTCTLIKMWNLLHFSPLWLIFAYSGESYCRLELWGLHLYGSSSMRLINKCKKSNNGNVPGCSLKRSKEFSGIWVPSCSGNHNVITQNLKWW